MIERYYTLGMNDKLILNFHDIGHTMRHISEGKGSQRRILIILLEEGSSITQSELTQRLGIQPGSASEVLGKLESAGLIRRTPSEIDRRTTDITLTEAGAALGQEAAMAREKRHQEMFSCLTDDEKETLRALLERINADWDVRYRQGEPSCNHRKEHHCGGNRR